MKKTANSARSRRFLELPGTKTGNSRATAQTCRASRMSAAETGTYWNSVRTCWPSRVTQTEKRDLGSATKT